MSFSGHPVCHLGLNWCILLGLFIFSSISQRLMPSIVLFERQSKFCNAFKYQISFAFISNITKHLPKWPYMYLINTLFGIFYSIFMFLFANYCLVLFLLQIKTSGFHLKEEGKELLGMLMAALANNNGYYVLYLFPLFFS